MKRRMQSPLLQDQSQGLESVQIKRGTQTHFKSHALSFLVFIVEMINPSFLSLTTVRKISTGNTDLPGRNTSIIRLTHETLGKSKLASSKRSPKNQLVKELQQTKVLKEVMRKVPRTEASTPAHTWMPSPFLSRSSNWSEPHHPLSKDYYCISLAHENPISPQSI